LVYYGKIVYEVGWYDLFTFYQIFDVLKTVCKNYPSTGERKKGRVIILIGLILCILFGIQG
jgi:hypothetical protein